jgi:hypothetical protein
MPLASNLVSDHLQEISSLCAFDKNYVVSVVLIGIQFILLSFPFSSLLIHSAFSLCFTSSSSHNAFFHMRLTFDLYSFRSQISVELLCVFLKHFVLHVLILRFFISPNSLRLCLYFLF